MSILRYDPTTHDWVIFAPERARRPTPLPADARPSEPAPVCPFCPGNEHMAPGEIFAIKDRSGPGWRVRVVPNKYPALRIEDETRRFADGDLFRWMGGCGAHEVVVESPSHDAFLGHESVEHVEAVLTALHARFNDLMRDSRFQTIVIFKNHGERAGTSLRHPHLQIIATPVVPRLLRLKHAIATQYFDDTGTCLYCVLLERELASGERVITENEHYTAVMPYAAHAPFETWILPRRHESSFGRVRPHFLRALAEVLRLVLAKLHAALGNPDFNLTVNTAPRGDEDKRYFLWHMEIVPRLATLAGFELGSGMSINTVLPEDAAEALRQAKTK